MLWTKKCWHQHKKFINKTISLRGGWKGEDQSNIHRVRRVFVHKQNIGKDQRHNQTTKKEPWQQKVSKDTSENNKCQETRVWPKIEKIIKLQVTSKSQEIPIGTKCQVSWWWWSEGSMSQSLVSMGFSGAKRIELEVAVITLRSEWLWRHSLKVKT